MTVSCTLAFIICTYNELVTCSTKVYLREILNGVLNLAICDFRVIRKKRGQLPTWGRFLQWTSSSLVFDVSDLIKKIIRTDVWLLLSMPWDDLSLPVNGSGSVFFFLNVEDLSLPFCVFKKTWRFLVAKDEFYGLFTSWLVYILTSDVFKFSLC